MHPEKREKIHVCTRLALVATSCQSYTTIKRPQNRRRTQGESGKWKLSKICIQQEEIMVLMYSFDLFRQSILFLGMIHSLARISDFLLLLAAMFFFLNLGGQPKRFLPGWWWWCLFNYSPVLPKKKNRFQFVDFVSGHNRKIIFSRFFSTTKHAQIT